ncbi:hypothetical protein B296_00028199 [Ensete ventricosum]|uniref:Uncharacterized protein n=1 Tax=Ensete ventricosum TaxID=4639 RepID=A0A426Y4J0_ENSVE|nr:hypothetical protein B296_00028199 [Ensete ventricosum]
MHVMLPLRFPNSGIRAKVVRVKDWQRENGAVGHGQAPVGATSCGQGPCRGGRTQLGPPARAVAHGQSEGVDTYRGITYGYRQHFRGSSHPQGRRLRALCP